MRQSPLKEIAVLVLSAVFAIGLAYLIKPDTFPTGDRLWWVLLRISVLVCCFGWIIYATPRK